MRYFDVLYGRVDLDDVVADILDRCWEVRRLKHVGMMNFRSISMHPLTHCSRLEHTLGVAYLAQRYSAANRFDPSMRRALVSAALYHDISCSPFGHSVEWALMARGKATNHEAAASWVTEPKLSAAPAGRPTFLDSLPFEPRAFAVDPSLFARFQVGDHGYGQLKSEDMDLDNIDNVFRMAHYLGFPEANRDHVFQLVDSLSTRPHTAGFLINAPAVEHLSLWQRLRGEVYRTFLYDEEYMSFECQIFELIGALQPLTDPAELARLSDFPDDILLWHYFLDDTCLAVRPLLRRLIANQSYRCAYLGRVENEELCNALPSASVAQTDRLRTIFVRTLTEMAKQDNNAFGELPLQKWMKHLADDTPIGSPIHFHLTTDKRKTSRRVTATALKADGESSVVSIGEDRFFVVAALLTDSPVERKALNALASCFAKSLSAWAGCESEEIFLQYAPPRESQLKLTL